MTARGEGEQEQRMWERLRWLMAGDEPPPLRAAQATSGQPHLQGEVEDALLFLEILQVRFQRRVEAAIHIHPDVCAVRLPRPATSTRAITCGRCSGILPEFARKRVLTGA